MPTLTVKLFEGRPVEVKKELAEALTHECCRVLDCAPGAVDILFEDIKKHDWATAGVLWSERD